MQQFETSVQLKLSFHIRKKTQIQEGVDMVSCWKWWKRGRGGGGVNQFTSYELLGN